MKGAISKKGYLTDSPDRKNDFNIVPSNHITMKGVDQPLKLIPIKFPSGYTGDPVSAKPGRNYKFPGYNMVLELPTNLMQEGGSPYSRESQVPVMPYYNTGPLQQFYGIMDQGGTPYPVQSQLPVMNGYNASPQDAYTFYKQGGDAPCIPCMLDHMQRMQQGGTPMFADATGDGSTNTQSQGMKPKGPYSYEEYSKLDPLTRSYYDNQFTPPDAFFSIPASTDNNTRHIYGPDIVGYKINGDPIYRQFGQEPGRSNAAPTSGLPGEEYNVNHVYGPDIIGYNQDGSPIYRQFGQSTGQQPQTFYPNPKGQQFTGNKGKPQGQPKSDSTTELQKKLNSLGADLVVDGKWGPKTQAAYNKYMGGQGLHSGTTYPARNSGLQQPPNMKFQQGGTPTFDQYYKDLNAWQNPNAKSVPTNIANYESTWIVPTIKTYQTTLNAALAKKYNLQAGANPAQNQFLTAQEAQGALGGSKQYGDYLNYVQGYQAYRGKTSGTYQAPSQTAGTMDPNGEAYGYRHFGLFQLSPQQQQANQQAMGVTPKPAMQMGGAQEDNMQIMAGGGDWIGKASDAMDKKGTKGTFTSYCGGKVTEECIKRGLASSNPTTRKRAAFAKAMHHIAKKKTGGDVPGQYEGLGYLQRHNADFINHVAQNFNIHSANQEIDTMEQLHQKMFGGTHFQMGGANTPLGNIYSQTNMDQGTPIDLAPNPIWNVDTPNMQTPPNQYQPVMMDPNQLQGRPVTSALQPEKHKNWYMSTTPVQRANGILAGTSAIAGMLEKSQRAKQDELLRKRLGADSAFTPVSGNRGSRGDYDTNSGMFRPDMMVPTQFPGGAPTGYGNGSYKSGGEYYMSEQDIQRILDDGGEIEYID